MAKKGKKTDVFLIVDEDGERAAFAKGLQKAGYILHDYMTAREFLIDKPKYSAGVVVAEFRLKSITGLELAQKLSKERSNFAVVLIANRQDMPRVVAKDSADVITKPASLAALQAAIVRATDGEVFTEAELQATFGKLTKRELKIAGFVIAGKSSQEIANQLAIARNTVETHRANIIGKTRAVDIGHLARLWRAWKKQK
jgi:two-component system CheB/CheR fusion protein